MKLDKNIICTEFCLFISVKSWIIIAASSGEGNGTHSSTLAWKIPWMEEPGRLQSMGSLRVRHD